VCSLRPGTSAGAYAVAAVSRAVVATASEESRVIRMGVMWSLSAGAADAAFSPE